MVHQFSVWLGPFEVRIEVADRGPSADGPTRCSARAYQVDIPEAERQHNHKGASSGVGRSMVDAIHDIHWWIFPRSDEG